MDLWHPSRWTDHQELMEPVFSHYLLDRRRLNRCQRATVTDTVAAFLCAYRKNRKSGKDKQADLLCSMVA